MSNRPRRPRASRRLRRLLSVTAISLAVGGIGSALSVATLHVLNRHPPVHAAPGVHIAHPAEANRETFLLIGTDARPKDDKGNSDVLCVLSLDTLHKRIELLSIPRDSQVAFPDGRYHKINDALFESGPVFAKQMVENVIGLPIDHYAVVRFEGLVHIIDHLGGIDVDVPRRMVYNTGDSQYGRINLRPGIQHLSGEQALGFVRFRHDALGDIGRTKRQQAFLLALQKQLMRPETIPKIPAILRDIEEGVDTDVTPLELGRLATQSPRFRSYTTVHGTLPGSFHNPDKDHYGDLSYWVINPKQARYVSKRFFEDGIISPNPVQDPSVTQHWETPTETPSSPQS